MKKLFLAAFMVALLAGMIYAEEVQYRTKQAYFSNTTTVTQDSISLVLNPTRNTNDTLYIAFPFKYDTYNRGFNSLMLDLPDSAYVEIWGFPCIATSVSRSNSITLEQVWLHQADDSQDSIAVFSDSLYHVGQHMLHWGTRAGGDDLPWGPADGIMHVFKWKLAQAVASDSSFVFKMLTQ